LKYYVGCSDWRYPSWTDFYSSTLDAKDYLAYYSKVFDFVEIDLARPQQVQQKTGRGEHKTINTDENFKNKINNRENYFSALPTKNTIKKWSENTPHSFRFTLKLPPILTNNTAMIGGFLEELAPLEEKILALAIHQPAVPLMNGRQWLEEVLDICTYHGYTVALEFDHYSWYQDLTYHVLKNHNAALIWSDIVGHRRHHYHPVVTADFLYLRINENERKWIEKIREEEHERVGKTQNGEEGLDFAVMVVDNPSKVNTVLNLLSLPQRKYGHAEWIGRIVMCVDLNAFFPSCEELRDPSLVGKPHAVIMTDEQKRKITKGAVASCSYEARKFGIRSAMSLSRAKELYPALILNPVDMQYYRDISENVMRILEEYADSLEQSSIDEAYMDCTLKINSNPSIAIEDYALRIKKSISEQCGLLTSIGVANTKSAAKIASDFQKPDGLTIVSPDKMSAFLEKMRVDAISGIGIKTQQVLREEFGTETIGSLAKQDVQKLIDRFGRKHGLWMWQVAKGSDADIVVPREDNISISSEQTLYPITKDKKNIQKYLNELVDEVYERANRKGYEFRTVGIKIVRSDFSIETRETSYSNYQNKQESISSVIEDLLDKISFSSFSPHKNSTTNTFTVRKVGIKLSNLIRIEKKKPPDQKTLLDYF
jgi:DNA polymerase IV (archaeal DinB-like DNA polymerase)